MSNVTTTSLREWLGSLDGPEADDMADLIDQYDGDQWERFGRHYNAVHTLDMLIDELHDYLPEWERETAEHEGIRWGLHTMAEMLDALYPKPHEGSPV